MSPKLQTHTRGIGQHSHGADVVLNWFCWYNGPSARLQWSQSGSRRPWSIWCFGHASIPVCSRWPWMSRDNSGGVWVTPSLASTLVAMTIASSSRGEPPWSGSNLGSFGLTFGFCFCPKMDVSWPLSDFVFLFAKTTNFIVGGANFGPSCQKKGFMDKKPRHNKNWLIIVFFCGVFFCRV